MGSRSYNDWGPEAWYKFHKKATTYADHPSDRDIKDILYYYNKLFLNYVDCDTCKKDYLKILRDHPVNPSCKISLFMWTVDVHNIINKKIHKEKISYKKA